MDVCISNVIDSVYNNFDVDVNEVISHVEVYLLFVQVCTMVYLSFLKHVKDVVVYVDSLVVSRIKAEIIIVH